MRLDFPRRVRRRRKTDPARFVLAHLGRALVAVYVPWLLVAALAVLLHPQMLLGHIVRLAEGKLLAVAASLGNCWADLVGPGAVPFSVAAVLVVWPYSLVAAPLWRLAHPLAGLLLGPPTAAFVQFSWNPAALPPGAFFGLATGLMLAVLPQPVVRIP